VQDVDDGGAHLVLRCPPLLVGLEQVDVEALIGVEEVAGRDPGRD
jgi:hypothetical protein